MEYGLLDYGKVGGDVEDFGNPSNFLFINYTIFDRFYYFRFP